MGTTKAQDTSQNALHLPAWAPTVATTISKHGPFALIAVYLIWQLANGSVSEHRAIAAQIEAHTQESRVSSSRSVALLQQICVNTADSPEERAACWSVR